MQRNLSTFLALSFILSFVFPITLLDYEAFATETYLISRTGQQVYLTDGWNTPRLEKYSPIMNFPSNLNMTYPVYSQNGVNRICLRIGLVDKSWGKMDPFIYDFRETNLVVDFDIYYDIKN